MIQLHSKTLFLKHYLKQDSLHIPQAGTALLIGKGFLWGTRSVVG
jgi:hypothetical protein